MSELIMFDVDDEVTANPRCRDLIGEELGQWLDRVPLRIIWIEDLSGADCNCRRPRGRNHRPMCATRTVERNGGHPQLLFFEVNGRRLRASAAWFLRA